MNTTSVPTSESSETGNRTAPFRGSPTRSQTCNVNACAAPGLAKLVGDYYCKEHYMETRYPHVLADSVPSQLSNTSPSSKRAQCVFEDAVRCAAVPEAQILEHTIAVRCTRLVANSNTDLCGKHLVQVNKPGAGLEHITREEYEDEVDPESDWYETSGQAAYHEAIAKGLNDRGVEPNIDPEYSTTGEPLGDPYANIACLNCGEYGTHEVDCAPGEPRGEQPSPLMYPDCNHPAVTFIDEPGVADKQLIICTTCRTVVGESRQIDQLTASCDACDPFGENDDGVACHPALDHGVVPTEDNGGPCERYDIAEPNLFACRTCGWDREAHANRMLTDLRDALNSLIGRFGAVSEQVRFIAEDAENGAYGATKKNRALLSTNLRAIVDDAMDAIDTAERNS